MTSGGRGQRAIRPQQQQHRPHHGPGDAGLAADHRLRRLPVRLAGAVSADRHAAQYHGHRGPVPAAGRQAGQAVLTGRLRAVERLAAGTDLAALGAVVDRGYRWRDCHRDRQTGVRRHRPEPVQPRHGGARGVADFLPGGDDHLPGAAPVAGGRLARISGQPQHHFRSRCASGRRQQRNRSGRRQNRSGQRSGAACHQRGCPGLVHHDARTSCRAASGKPRPC